MSVKFKIKHLTNLLFVRCFCGIYYTVIELYGGGSAVV